jgi:tetratricopeptide (TPR) repeat protein
MLARPPYPAEPKEDKGSGCYNPRAPGAARLSRRTDRVRMELLSSLFDNPLVPWAVGLVVLLFVYRFVAERVSIRAPGGLSKESIIAKLLGPRWAEKKLEREIARLKKQDNHLAAGRALEDAGRLSEAADAYLEGHEYWAAAATFEKLGRAERAAELYLQAGDHKKGAALFTAAGKPARAAKLFLEKGNNLEAARLFGQAGQWGMAADLYEKSGYPLRAAEAWEKDAKPLRAAEAYEKHFMENVSFSTTYSATAATAESKSARLAGQLYEKAEQLDRAIQIYVKGGFHREAAEALLRTGEPAKAAELFLRAEDPERAAVAFEQAGDVVRAAGLRGEAAFKEDRAAEAAAWFVKGRDFLRAAELYESVGMIAEAATAYEAGESWAAAGGVYVRAGLKDRAAAAYEKAGEYETAAALFEQLGDARRAGELYARAGHTFKSGEAAARAGERDQAIALLQRVPPGDEHHRDATLLLARLFIEIARPVLARERLQKEIGDEEISVANLELHYWLALANEASGARADALALYKKIQAEDLNFHDVNERVARLAGAASPQAPPAAAPSPPPGPAPAAPAPAPPRPAAARPPRFVPKEEIGKGPLGVIFRGEDTTDGRSVAMRILPTALLAPPGLLQALAADLKAASVLSHPNLIKTIALMEWKGERCLVTEHFAGRTFAEAIASGRRLGFQQVHALGRIVAQVLAFVHGKGLVHGSIQPSNVMVASGVIKVSDLGLGRLAHALPGDGGYRSPEGRLDATGDLYALAAVMYHLLTGKHPSSQPQGVGLPLPSQLAPGVPEAMDRMLLRALHPRPELRLQSAEDLVAELRNMVKIG